MNLVPFSQRVCPFVWIFLLSCVPMPRAASGTILASDSASDPAYAADVGGAWKGLNPSTNENPAGTDNGGFGFAAWDFAGGYHAELLSPYGQLNHFIDGVDFAGSSFNNLGAPAFGLTNANQAYEGYTSRATRVFNSPLAVGDTLSIEFDNPVLAPLDVDDTAGFLFRLNTGGGPHIASRPDVTERFGMFVTSGLNNDNWTTTDLSGFTNTGVNSLSTTLGAQFQFTLTAPNSYLVKLIRRSDGQTLLTRAGLLSNLNRGPIDSLEIALFGNGSGNGLTGLNGLPTGEREFFFNNLRVDQLINPALLTGDFDQNGIVNAADYLIWRKGVDILYTQEHYDIWRAHFGQTIPAAGAGSSAAFAVPEPTAVALVLINVIVLLFADRRHQARLSRVRHQSALVRRFPWLAR